MASERTILVPILSDLGTRDPHVAEFKAAVHAITKNVRFIDVTHDIRPRDLLEGAFTLNRVFREFKPRTIFAVLLEQFRGAPSRPLLAVSMDYYYFAPDNGVLSFVYERDPVTTVYHVTAEHYIETPPRPLSPHRDTYGSAVGWLAKGIDSSNFGESVTDYVRLNLPQPTRKGPKEIEGQVLHVGRDGVLVTSIHQDVINGVRQEVGVQVPFQAVLAGKAVPVTAGWTQGAPEVIGVFGTAGYLEIVGVKADASQVLGAKRGDAVSIVFGG